MPQFVQQMINPPAVQSLKLVAETAIKAADDKRSYTEKLEGAKGDDVFKYVLLIIVSALEGYVAQTRIQAEESFSLSKVIAVAGFVLLVAGIALGFYTSIAGKGKLEASYLASIAGIVTELISGVFFYLYNRTLQQLNLFHDKLVMTEKMAMSLLASSLVSDATKRDDSKVDLAKALMSSSLEETPQ